MVSQDIRLYDVDFARAFSLTVWAVDQMALDLYYANPMTGRILCHIDRAEYKVDGYLDIKINRRPEGTEFVVLAEKYYLLDLPKFREVVASFYYLIDQGLLNNVQIPLASSTVVTFSRPTRLRPILQNTLTVIVFLILASIVVIYFGVVEVGVYVMFLLMSPFLMAILLMSVGKMRWGGMISYSYAAFAGASLGFVTWIILLPVAMIGGRLAMQRGKWVELHDEITNAMRDVSGPIVTEVGTTGGR